MKEKDLAQPLFLQTIKPPLVDKDDEGLMEFNIITSNSNNNKENRIGGGG